MAKLAYTLPTDRVTQLATHTLSTGTPLTGYGLDKLYDLDPSNPLWLSGTSIDLRMQFPSPQRIDWLSLHHTNFTTGLTLMGHTANSWGAPSLTQAIAAPTAHEDGFYRHMGLDLAAAVPTAGSRTFEWWRLFNASANGSAIRIGELAIYDLLNRLTRNIQWQVVRPEEHGVSSVAGKKGVKYVHKRHTRYRKVLAQVPHATDAGYASFLSWRRSAFGMADPFVLVPAGADSDEPLFVRHMTPGHEPVMEFLDVNALKLEFEELSCGEAY